MNCYKCLRCNGIWTTVLERPKRCGVCGSALWEKKRVRAKGAGRPNGSGRAVEISNTGTAEPGPAEYVAPWEAE